MCDQLSTLGVEFNFTRLTGLFHETLLFSAAHPFPYAPGASSSKASSFLPSAAKPALDSLKRSFSKLLRGSHKRSPSSTPKPSSNGHLNGTTTPSPTTPINGPLPWAHPPIFTPPPHHTPTSTTNTPKPAPRRDSTECTHLIHPPSSTPPCPRPHPASTTPPQTLLQTGARPWGLGTIRAPTSSLTTLAGKTVRRPGRVLRVDETTNEDTAEPLVGTNERVHSCVRVRLGCGGLGLDDAGGWGCEALTGRKDSTSASASKAAGGDGTAGKGGGGGWRLERGSALAEGEEREVRVAREMGPREVRLPAGGMGGEYPAEAMYPVGEEDHAWRWVWEGKVDGEGQGRMPQVLALPEEPLVGYWERCLLGLMAGEVDVWRYAQRGIQG